MLTERMQTTQIESTENLYLIIGLGNPGRKFRDNRHNIGFMLIDELSNRVGIQLSRIRSRAIMGIGSWNNQKLILAKPQTYMNLSGQSVSGLVRFYKVPLERLILVHDDMDLPFGTLRIRPGGGSAGQKGLNSIIERLGSKEFPRLRMGVGHPGGHQDPADYLLEDFSAAEQKLLSDLLARACDAVLTIISCGIVRAMNEYNGLVDRG